MKPGIVNSTEQDIDKIFSLYGDAIGLQKKLFNKHWQSFEVALIKKEIAELRQWKLMVDGAVAGIFAVTYNDPEIWRERDADAAIYLHRIVAAPGFRGNNLVNYIIDWARHHATEKGLTHIRLDTFADNEKLTGHYIKCGFTHVDTVTLQPMVSLPAHYAETPLALFEIKVNDT
jgi:GNAT superfamily N-acetyltransferase